MMCPLCKRETTPAEAAAYRSCEDCWVGYEATVVVNGKILTYFKARFGGVEDEIGQGNLVRPSGSSRRDGMVVRKESER